MSVSNKVMVDYIPAQLHKTKNGWYIDYYAFHHGEMKLHRKQVRLNKIKSITERSRFAKRLVQKINQKLNEGWNPFIEQEAPKSFFRLSQAIKSFKNDKRNLRPDSLRAYNNFLKLFQEWSEARFNTDTFIINIDGNVAVNYMEDMWKRDIATRRYNNYLRFQILLWNWLIEHKFTKANPFQSIKKKKESNKKRIMDIAQEDRIKIRDYLRMHNKQYLAIVFLAFHTLLRPKEITFLKARNIDLKKQVIYISGSFSKNHNDRIATIPNVMVPLLKEILLYVRKDDFIFTDNNFNPGKKQATRRYISRYWESLRNHLEIKKEVQFYSLRDSGIIQKLRDGLDPKTVMELADHSSLEITNKYVKMAATKGNVEAMEKITKF